MEVKGSMMLRINDPVKSQCSLQLSLFEDPNVQYMVNVDSCILTSRYLTHSNSLNRLTQKSTNNRSFPNRYSSSVKDPVVSLWVSL